MKKKHFQNANSLGNHAIRQINKYETNISNDRKKRK